MSKGQYTVLVLLLALLGLEILRSPNVRAFFGGLIPNLTNRSNPNITGGTVNTGGVTVTSRNNLVNTGGVTVTSRMK